MWGLVTPGPYLLPNLLKHATPTHTPIQLTEASVVQIVLHLFLYICPIAFSVLGIFYVLGRTQDSCGTEGRDIGVHSKQKQVLTLVLTINGFW